MRTFIIILVLSLAASMSATAADNDCFEYTFTSNHDCRVVSYNLSCCPWDFDPGCCIRNYDIEIDDGTIILSPRSRGYAEVKITDDCRLYVNGRKVDLDDDQKELVMEFHSVAVQIQEDAKKIGKEGAKIGIAGARLGVEALASVFKLLRSDYDSEDLEREIERKAAKIEARAGRLEARAEKIEEMACKLEMIEEKLERQIPEMRERDSF